MIVEKAYAKINWALAIKGRREDGYHLLDMLMQTVSLYDALTFVAADTLALEVDANPALSTENNLVMRAARALQEASGVQKGAHITLQKEIPIGAGMGGGSADAAAALVGLCKLWDITLPPADLHRLAIGLGADVPFFLTGGLARVQGIGEMIRPISVGRAFHLVILQPAQGLSTPQVFRMYDTMGAVENHPYIDEVEAALRAGDSEGIAASASNDLQAAAVAILPDVMRCTGLLEAQGAVRALMTGSGSAVYGLFETAEAAQAAYARCKAETERCWLVHTR